MSFESEVHLSFVWIYHAQYKGCPDTILPTLILIAERRKVRNQHLFCLGERY